jgi:hypothetical protein
MIQVCMGSHLNVMVFRIPFSWEVCKLCVWGFLATDPEARVRFPALPEKKVVGLKRGAFSLVSTTEELLGRKVEAPV